MSTLVMVTIIVAGFLLSCAGGMTLYSFFGEQIKTTLNKLKDFVVKTKSTILESHQIWKKSKPVVFDDDKKAVLADTLKNMTGIQTISKEETIQNENKIRDKVLNAFEYEWSSPKNSLLRNLSAKQDLENLMNSIGKLLTKNQVLCSVETNFLETNYFKNERRDNILLINELLDELSSEINKYKKSYDLDRLKYEKDLDRLKSENAIEMENI